MIRAGLCGWHQTPWPEVDGGEIVVWRTSPVKHIFPCANTDSAHLRILLPLSLTACLYIPPFVQEKKTHINSHCKCNKMFWTKELLNIVSHRIKTSWYLTCMDRHILAVNWMSLRILYFISMSHPLTTPPLPHPVYITVCMYTTRV